MAGLMLHCRDETGEGEWLGELRLALEDAAPTVRQLIRERVAHEAERHNAELDRGRQFRGLVTAPPAVTSELNGWAQRRRVSKAVDSEAMVAVATRAYERGDLDLVIDGRPAGGIDAKLALADGSVAVFRKLAALALPQTNPGRARSKYEIEQP